MTMIQKVLHIMCILTFKIILCKAYMKDTDLHLIRIYFGAQTFDKITKDVKTTFEDKISNIGGTLGLFTGFNIFSILEVVYFAGKLVYLLYKRRGTHRNVVSVQEANSVPTTA